MAKYDGWNDNCAHSPATDPAPPKDSLQGDAGTPNHASPIHHEVKSTSRGGNTDAGGHLMAPRPVPKGTGGSGKTAESIS